MKYRAVIREWYEVLICEMVKLSISALHGHERSRSPLLWDITQRRLLILYWRFGTTYRSHFQGSRSPRRLEYGTDRLSRNVGEGLPLGAALISQNSADLINTAAEAWNHGYPEETNGRTLLNRSLVGPHSRCGNFGEEKNPLLLPGIEPRIVRAVALSMLFVIQQMQTCWWHRTFVVIPDKFKVYRIFT
jgi:hypothetical protein